MHTRKRYGLALAPLACLLFQQPAGAHTTTAPHGEDTARSSNPNKEQCAQQCPDDTKHPDREAIKAHFIKSYATLSNGYDFNQNTKTDDIFYEAQLAASLHITDNLTSATGAIRYLLYAPMRIQVRQFRSDSAPVKTPSYNPGVRVFFWHDKMFKKEFAHYFSFGLHHYSNGQAGAHLDSSTGLVNTENGTFSTNYAEFSYYRLNRQPQPGLFYWQRYTARQHFTGAGWEDEQTDYYQNGLLEWSSKHRFQALKDSELQVTLGYKLGRKYILPGQKTNTSDNLQVNLQWTTERPFGMELKKVGFYMRYDYGFDYYNINYQKQINRVQFGIYGITF